MGAEFTISPASAGDLAGFASWYDLVEDLVLDEAAEVINARYVEAFDSGILGCALGIDDRKEVRAALDRAAAAGPEQTALIRHSLARSAIFVATDREGVAGVAELTPPIRAVEQIFRRLEQQRASREAILDAQWKSMVQVSKLRLVAVRPDMRGRGVGSELIEQALQLAAASGVKQVYGQFSASPELARFYLERGFTVRDVGVPIKVVGGNTIQSRATEQLFYSMVRLRYRN